MTYCPECGSEVAPENTFCAYCGIGLTPITPVAENQPEKVSQTEESTGADRSEQDFGMKDVPAAPMTAEDNSSSANKSGVEPEKLAENPEELPATLVAYDNRIPNKEWTDQLNAQKSEAQNDFSFAGGDKDFDSNIASASDAFGKDESQVIPTRSPDEKKIDAVNSDARSFSDSSDHSLQNLPDSPNINEVNEFSADNKSGISETENNKSEELPSWDDFSINKIPPSPPSANIETPNAAGGDDRIAEFEATIPYTPKDFKKQDISAAPSNISDPISKNEPVQNVEGSMFPIDAPSFGKTGGIQDPIAKPQSPVGSSAHDSLEPRLVSVQIYNPDEKPEGETSSKPESLYDSQTLLKHPVSVPKNEPTEQPRESRAYTSPNMGKEDTAGRGKAKLKPLDEGTVLNGRYEIIRKIGGGGMGAVYLASDRNLGGVLRAVKEMVQSYIEDTQQEKAVNDFKRESLLLTSLEHPAIPTIFDYFYDEKEGRFYLVMKYISGGDLAGRMRAVAEGKLDEATVTDWGMQVADVLDYLHNRQPPIVYRDLKPSNIMIDGNTGRIMLIDFGIARWVNKEEKGVTAVGTMGYAPPELFSGNVEPRSDIYSLGSTMFHLLTGADPQSNPLLIFDFNKNPRPRQINSTLSDQIEQILLRMVEYNADRRFSSAAELRDALNKHKIDLQTGKVTHGVSSAAIGNQSQGFAGAGAPPPSSNSLVFCGFCGQKIVASDVFCPFCGAQQPTAANQSGGAYVAPKQTARIFVIGTSELDTPMFSLEKDNNLVGRRDPMSNIFPEIDLSKFDPQTKISRKHARIWRESGNFMVEDLGSSNGTVLITASSEPVRLMKNQPQMLTNGDKIRVGDTTLHFVVG